MDITTARRMHNATLRAKEGNHKHGPGHARGELINHAQIAADVRYYVAHSLVVNVAPSHAGGLFRGRAPIDYNDS